MRPDIGVIINIGYAHIGYFGSLANIAKAKFEITDGMKKSGVSRAQRRRPAAREKGIKMQG